MKVLIVDDELMLRQLIRRLLESKGHEVIEAQNGLEALDIVDDSVDLIFLDWLMPEMSGLEFLENFCADKTVKHPHIIMLTALGEMDNVVDAMELGANGYIIKPFSPDTIIDKLDELAVN